MDNCLAPASDVSGIGCDNMTILIVGLLNGKTKEEWYDLIAERVANNDGPVAPSLQQKQLDQAVTKNLATRKKKKEHMMKYSAERLNQVLHCNSFLELVLDLLPQVMDLLLLILVRRTSLEFYGEQD